MEVIILDGLKINNEIDFFTMLYDQVTDFGDFFGCNLDAFNDYIGILGGKIIWNNFYETEKNK